MTAHLRGFFVSPFHKTRNTLIANALQLRVFPRFYMLGHLSNSLDISSSF